MGAMHPNQGEHLEAADGVRWSQASWIGWVYTPSEEASAGEEPPRVWMDTPAPWWSARHLDERRVGRGDTAAHGDQ